MTITAKIILDSKSPADVRLTTLELTYPRFIHAEFMTHRMFSRNASSSRAIPVAKLIEQVRTNPAMPVHWGKNQAGMQARKEHNDLVLIDRYEEVDIGLPEVLFERQYEKVTVREAWRSAAADAAFFAEQMSDAGYHKQIVNRLLEPFLHITVIVTATEWDNFFKLRLHPDAQPEMQALALAMQTAMNDSTPVERKEHLPYLTENETVSTIMAYPRKALISAARCARVSYLNHDGTTPNIDKDLELAEKLTTSGHASPFEHQANCTFCAPYDRCNNFRGWYQFRASLGC